MKSCKEMAKQWGVTERTVTTFCKTGKIPGVVKEGKSWRIPDGAEKPADGRVLSGKYVKKEEKEMCIRDRISTIPTNKRHAPSIIKFSSYGFI